MWYAESRERVRIQLTEDLTGRIRRYLAEVRGRLPERGDPASARRLAQVSPARDRPSATGLDVACLRLENLNDTCAPHPLGHLPGNVGGHLTIRVVLRKDQYVGLVLVDGH